MSYKLKVAIKYLKYFGLIMLIPIPVTMLVSGLLGSILCGFIGYILGGYIQEAVMWEIENEN